MGGGYLDVLLMPLASGIELPERYRVTRHIASGGMASVWEVEDLLLDRVVAVKVLGAQYASDRGARARFQREARTAARVSEHAHIATIYDTGEHGEDTYIVMEFFSGGTVADRLRAARDGNAPVDRETALRWLREAAAGLDAAHAAGIVHRDVKPANLLIDANDRLAVGDFGIARLADDTHMTQTGQVLGTAAYLSPEQAMGQPATAASDRYALAVVAYELLTGRRPFAGGPVTAQARQHVEDEPEPASEAEPDLPPAIDAAFARGLAKDARDRPITAAALIDEIERALGGPVATESTRAMAPIVPIVPRPPPRLRRRRRAAAGRARTPRPAPAPAAAAWRRDDTPPFAAAPVRDPREPGRAHRPSPFVAIGLAAALVIGILAIALANAGGDDPKDARAVSTTPDATKSTKATPPPAAAQTPTTETPAAGTDASTGDESPSQLNDRGYSLMQSGDNAAAVPLLQRSVDGFRASGTKSNINYHYALYNLAGALMATGDPAAAIPLSRGAHRDQQRPARARSPDARPGAGRRRRRGRWQEGEGQGQGRSRLLTRLPVDGWRVDLYIRCLMGGCGRIRAIGLIATLATLGAPQVGSALAAPALPVAKPAAPALRAVPQGAAVRLSALRSDSTYRDTFAREFDSLTPENELKLAALQPRRGQFDFAAADELVDYARRAGKAVHGHTLVWGLSLPLWLVDHGATEKLGLRLPPIVLPRLPRRSARPSATRRRC